MKIRKAITTYVLLPIGLFVVFNAMVLAIIHHGPDIETSVIKNINIAQEKYPGNAEEALIAFLLDTTNTYEDRSHIAIWTLGQIKSRKALPLIQQLYKDDPSGVTCRGRHDKVICQCVLHKAIVAIESDRVLYSGLNK
jgi:hypothetical protein